MTDAIRHPDGKSASMSAAQYERAAAFLPSALNAKLGGSVVDGYWIDERRYFFRRSERGGDGRSVAIPMIANAEDGTVEPAAPLARLAALLSSRADGRAEVADLADAEFDMPDADTLVVRTAEFAYHVELPALVLRRTETRDPVPQLYAPDGRHSCFLDGEAVWLKDRESGATRRLTERGDAQFAFGRPPESGITPISQRKNPKPSGLWSSDSKWFVTHRIDERHLPRTGIVENAPPGGGRPVPHLFRIAGPEDEPPLVEFTAFHIPDGREVRATRKIIPQIGSPFAFRQCWMAGHHFYFLSFDRFTADVALVELDLETGSERTVLAEQAADGWIDLHPTIGSQPIVRTLSSSREVIWFSERDGWGHLYLYDLDTGALKNRITHGEWMVREIVHIDEAERYILFLASGVQAGHDPGWRCLCRVGFDGSGFRLVLADGDIDIPPDPVCPNGQDKLLRPSYARAGVSPGGRHAFAWLGGVDRPTKAVIIALESGTQHLLGEVDILSHWPAPVPRPFEVLANDGITRLHGAIYLPSDFDETRSYPIIDFVYPGPQSNPFVRRFPSNTSMLLQSIAELGFIGMVLETRGMPLRSRAFHLAGRRHMHEPQLSDNVAALRQLFERHSFIDPDRVGIFGQSGGGYATARALFDYPDMFKAGVAICGNHDSRNYIGYWLDKYGGRPGTIERDDQSNIPLAGKLQGRLFLIHGDMDENVHVGHTLALSAALIDAGKDFTQLIVPNAGHEVLMESAYVIQRLWDFFVRHLLHTEPPADFQLRPHRPEKKLK